VGDIDHVGLALIFATKHVAHGDRDGMKTGKGDVPRSNDTDDQGSIWARLCRILVNVSDKQEMSQLVCLLEAGDTQYSE
jgi:hypothetical protein